MRETIFALASGVVPAAVAVIRISGPLTHNLLETICSGQVPKAREARLRTFRGESGEALDQGLVLWFPGPNSFTGEDAAELHCHGSPAVVADLSARLVTLGATPAERGAFARRAFEAGRMDVLELEGLADLVVAETTGQRRQALRQMEGGLSQQFTRWRRSLLGIQARIEAILDFADEDLGEGVLKPVFAEIVALKGEVTEQLAAGARAARLRQGLAIAIVGPPNVGKSTLLNRLAGHAAAIVSPVAGTTRDIVEVPLVLAGVPVTVADTAGLRESDDLVEQEGVRRAAARAQSADIVMKLISAETGDLGLREAEEDPEARSHGERTVLRILTKCDLATERSPEAMAQFDASISAQTGSGMDQLLARLSREIEALAGMTEVASWSRERHRAGLAATLTGLERVSEQLRRAETSDGDAEALVFAAEECRSAADALGLVVGEMGVEDMLDSLFSEFCIGK